MIVKFTMHQPKMKDLEETKAQYEDHGPHDALERNVINCVRRRLQTPAEFADNISENAANATKLSERPNQASECAKDLKSKRRMYAHELEYELEEAEETIVSLKKQLQKAEATIVHLEKQLHDEKSIKNSLGKQLQDEKSPTVSLEKQVQDVACSDATPPQIERAPHPFCFSGDSIDWQEFKLKMCFKMQLDGHLYPTANDRLTYVMTRLKTDAFDEVCSFFKDDGTLSIPDKPEADFMDLLQILENAFS